MNEKGRVPANGKTARKSRKEPGTNEKPTDRRIRFRAAIEAFTQERLDAKLAEDDPRRDALVEQHQSVTWLADAARRAGQIQAVTHSLKPIHPDARGSNLYFPPDTLPRHAEIGSSDGAHRREDRGSGN